MAEPLQKNILRLIYEWIVTISCAIFFIVSCLILTVVLIAVKPFLGYHQGHQFGRRAMHYGTRLFFAVLRMTGIVSTDFKDLDKLRDERGIIITPNHPCLMDALFVSSRLPNVVCVMKGSVISNPLFFGCAYLGGFIRSDTPACFVQKCRESLEEGAQLLLFPEGTRTLSNSVNPFKGGFSLIAQKTGATIQPVFIEANSNFLGKDWQYWKKPSFPLNYRTTLGEQFKVEKGQDHRAFTKNLESYFKTHLPNEIH